MADAESCEDVAWLVVQAAVEGRYSAAIALKRSDVLAVVDEYTIAALHGVADHQAQK